MGKHSRTQTKEHIEKRMCQIRGRNLSEKSRKTMSIAKRKRDKLKKSVKTTLTCDHCNNIFEKYVYETDKNEHYFCSRNCYFSWVKGENSYLWKGGITPTLLKIRNSREYATWRFNVFKRDDFTCQFCGIRSLNINAHHLKYFSLIIEENSILSFGDALLCKELWYVNNGITLCERCHKNEHKKEEIK